MRPETRYAKSGDVNIAYQVIGQGPPDLVYVMGWVSNIEWFWEEPSYARFLRRLASFSRLIIFDKRGTGLSDRVAVTQLPTLEQRMDDVRAVMDAVGSHRAALVGISEGGPLCALFAATYPERTTALVMIGSYARRLWAEDYRWGVRPEQHEAAIKEIEQQWGGPVWLEPRAPSVWHDKAFRDWWAAYLRMSASPGAVVALTRMNAQIDVRHVLPAIRVPTMVIHRTGDRTLPVAAARWMAQQIQGATMLELLGEDHLPWVGNQDEILNGIGQFLTGMKHRPEADRVLATVLFTDIVRSTEKAAELGDRDWKELLDEHNELVRRELARFRGREVKSTGDGFLATFDGPGRGIRAAQAVIDGVKRLGIEVRAGLHTGECELLGQDVGGIAVHIAARVAGQAETGEVLVSRTVKDLVAGSGIEFEERGAQRLKGVPGEWQLFRVINGRAESLS